MTPYSSHDDSSQCYSTEKNIEYRGLTVGRRAKLSTVKEVASRHRACIGTLVTVLFLFIISSRVFGRTDSLSPHLKAPKTANSSPNNGAKPLEGGDAPTWTFIAYSDDDCQKVIVDQNGQSSSDCQETKEEMAKVDFDGQNLFTVSIHGSGDCNGRPISYFSDGKCISGFNVTGWKIEQDEKGGSLQLFSGE
ncbi:MAG: hypothetical protein LQ342_000780 [Letrouitia transgressa]|nr:MAG: hypothetical protein LQ342_000780 [Letrouitia transgressa]